VDVVATVGADEQSAAHLEVSAEPAEGGIHGGGDEGFLVVEGDVVGALERE
jgi:hypothetical protein